jgi:hypothetical protein
VVRGCFAEVSHRQLRGVLNLSDSQTYDAQKRSTVPNSIEQSVRHWFDAAIRNCAIPSAPTLNCEPL